MRTGRRQISTSINAGSMADIAFLLLIFFLVVTTIVRDQGVSVILPPYYDGPVGQEADRNVMTILINDEDELLVEGEKLDPSKLKEKIIHFISNPDNDNDKPSSPAKAIVSLQNGTTTSYQAYITVYGQIKGAYDQLRNEMALSRFGESYNDLTVDEKNLILVTYPMKVSEADPFQI